VRWYVIGRDGQKYGPADLPTLQMWASENRVRPDTMLEEEGTGVQLPAQSVAGLTFLPVSSGSPFSSPATPSSHPIGETSPPTSGGNTLVEKWFVIAPDGKKYGPADLPTLQRWVDEGRVTPQTMIEEEIGGRRFFANTLPGLTFRHGVPGANPWAQPPGASPYPRAGYYAPQTTIPGSGDLTAAWVLVALGFLCGCAPLCFVAIYFADKARKVGNPGGQAAFIVSVILSVLVGIGTLVYLLVVAGMFSAVGAGL
jgi:hypothetical protein